MLHNLRQTYIPLYESLSDYSIIGMRRDGRRERLLTLHMKRKKNVSKSLNNTASPARSATSRAFSYFRSSSRLTGAGLPTPRELPEIQPHKLGKLHDAL